MTPRVESFVQRTSERLRLAWRAVSRIFSGPGGERDFCKSATAQHPHCRSGVPRRTTLSKAVPGCNRFLGFPSAACANLVGQHQEDSCVLSRPLTTSCPAADAPDSRSDHDGSRISEVLSWPSAFRRMGGQHGRSFLAWLCLGPYRIDRRPDGFRWIFHSSRRVRHLHQPVRRHLESTFAQWIDGITRPSRLRISPGCGNFGLRPDFPGRRPDSHRPHLARWWIRVFALTVTVRSSSTAIPGDDLFVGEQKAVNVSVVGFRTCQRARQNQSSFNCTRLVPLLILPATFTGWQGSSDFQNQFFLAATWLDLYIPCAWNYDET